MNKIDLNIIKERQKQLWVYDDTPMLIIIFIAIYFFVLFIVPKYLLTPVNIIGTSMEPTLYQNDRVILYMQGDIDYGDIVVLYAPNVFNQDTSTQGEDIIKRIMGMPGDTVWFEKEEGKYIFCRSRLENGMTVSTVLKEEFYTTNPGQGYTEQLDKIYKIGEEFELKENQYFVLGDNRLVSMDSRNPNVGLITKEQIIGKALFLIREGGFFIINNTGIFK